MKNNDTEGLTQSGRAFAVLALGLGIGLVGILLYGLQAPGIVSFGPIAGVAIMVACAAVLTGGLLGFLFGIPRTVELEPNRGNLAAADSKAPTDGNRDRARAPEVRYGANTNLEQISDWLTKILVGVGLTQISSLPSLLQSYAAFVGPGLGGFANSEAFAVALLIYFSLDGFIYSYLWTRLYFAGALRLAEAESRLEAVESKLDNVDTDSKAWGLVQRVLNPVPGTAPASQDEINSTIAAASPAMKQQVLAAAAQARSDNWRELPNKPKMERTIPIFRALVASDTENVFHANHGQLGFALKDKREPDWVGSIAELTEAIRLCGPWDQSGLNPYYELVRALCRINIDEAYANGNKSDGTNRDLIMADLAIAQSDANTRAAIQSEPLIKKWMDLNP